MYQVREADTGYHLETAFFGSVMGVVFQSGTASALRYRVFHDTSPARKVYKIGMSIQEFLSGYRYLSCFCADIEPGLRLRKVVLLYLILMRWKK